MLRFIFLLVSIATTQMSFVGKPIAKPLSVVQQASPINGVFTEVQQVDLSLVINVPCAAEDVQLEGSVLLNYHVTINGNKVLLAMQNHTQGLSGYGLSSGKRYQGSGSLNDVRQSSLVNGQTSFTFQDRFRLVSSGSNNNLFLIQRYHVTVNANGDITTEIIDLGFECW